VSDGQAEADNAVNAVEVCSRHKRNSAETLRRWHLTRRVAVSDTAELGEGEILAQLQHVLTLEPLRTHTRHFKPRNMAAACSASLMATLRCVLSA
jgi:negative regulator of sigma E activity